MAVIVTLLIVCLAVLSVVAEEVSTVTPLSVYFNSATNSFDVKNVYDSSADAFGKFYTNLDGGSWNYLDAHAQEEVSSVDGHLQYMRALGFLEGYSTCNKIKTFYPNFYSAVFGTDRPGAQTLAFLKENYKWLNQMADENAATDDYWYAVKSTLTQLNGVYEGYVKGCSSTEQVRAFSGKAEELMTLDHPTLEHFLLINAWGDLYQITVKFMEPGQNSRLFGSKSKNLKGSHMKLVERCSAIFKVLPDYSDIVFGHATWDTFESLGPRILKHYSFPLMRKGYAEHHYDVYFSSSPGILSSVDDFFTVSGYAQLAVIETTNSLYNIKLLDLVVPQSVLSWTRAVTSNQMASSGADWAQQFARYHSGTYTNQWMSLDFKLFTPSDPVLKPNLLTVFEEVPGLVHIEDMTSTLQSQGYWPSYNVPYFPDIFNASGYAKVCERDAGECYNTAPRAYIFKEYQSTVVDVYTAEKLLSHNDYQKDKASQDDPCNTVACRGDLEADVRSRGAFGALDTKVSSVSQAKRNPGVSPVILARLGPTHYQQPVFCWSQVLDEPDYVHNGQPDCFDFPVIQFPPASSN